jgi:mRNA interferase MazF
MRDLVTIFGTVKVIQFMTSSTGTKYNQGEIWLARVAFRDNPKIIKPRPIVIIGNHLAIDIDVIVDPITDAQHKHDDFDVEVVKWQEAGLAKPSVVRTSKPTTMHESMFIKKMGDMDPTDLANVLEKCKQLF